MGYQNFYATRLATDIGASDTSFDVETAPSVTSGTLTLEARNSTKREIITYTGVSGTTLTGVARGQGGTTATTHSRNALVEMNLTAEDLTAALAVPNDIITRFDETIGDHVASGCIWTDDTGLNADMSAGVVYINGIRLEVDAVSDHTFTASRDTYIDIGDNGTLDYNEESNGAAAPAIAASHLRLAKVITDGSDILGVVLYNNPAYLEKADGWQKVPGTHSVASTYNQGNRSFVIDTSTDLTGVVTPGMRYRVSRSVTPPDQCADLEASSSQYASLASGSVSGISFTDDFTVEAWVKLESYPSAEYEIITRFSTTGWLFRINKGRVQLSAVGGQTDFILSNQAIPLNKWVHVAATIDMSGQTGAIYIDGVSVPYTYSNGTSTSLTQAGNLVLGAYGAGTNPFDGKLADVRVWSDIRTATEIQDNMYKALVGNEGNLVGYWKLDGDFTDETSNANDLTASGGAAATDNDHPFNATEYGIVTAVSASDITVFCPIGYGIPNETLASPFYSTQDTPFGFPREKDKWVVETIQKARSTRSSPSANTWYGSDDFSGSDAQSLVIPVGVWDTSFSALVYCNDTSATQPDIYASLSTADNAETDELMTARTSATWATATFDFTNTLQNRGFVNLSSATQYYLVAKTGASGISNIFLLNDAVPGYIRAVCAYL